MLLGTFTWSRQFPVVMQIHYMDKSTGSSGHYNRDFKDINNINIELVSSLQLLQLQLFWESFECFCGKFVQAIQVLQHHTHPTMSLLTLLCALGQSHAGIEKAHLQTSHKFGSIFDHTQTAN